MQLVDLLVHEPDPAYTTRMVARCGRPSHRLTRRERIIFRPTEFQLKLVNCPDCLAKRE